MSALLFAPPGQDARRAWDAADFVSVNDTVRGGSSSSAMRIVGSIKDDAAAAAGDDDDEGAIDFCGFLDTTTLGGAGFASQAYSKPFPGQPIDATQFSGLRLVGRLPQHSADTSSNSSVAVPGGGKGPVKSFVLTLKTTEPKRRPDGRRESQISYEWKIDLHRLAPGGVFDVQSSWDNFHPTYRGRPAPDAPPLDPAQVKEWSIMARSDFGDQSGPFAVRLLTLRAVGAREKAKRRESSSTPPSYVVVAADDSGSGEYYGFALFIFATVVFVVWIVWALTPDELLNRIGIAWYPNREWAFLLPAWSLFAVLFVYAAFMALNTHNNPDLDQLSLVVDSHSNILPLSKHVEAGDEPHPLYGRSMAQTGGIGGPMADDIYDLPPGVVSRERHGL